MTKSSSVLSIGSLAKAADIPVATLRNWEKRYGFPRPMRLRSGHRRYSTEVLERLRWVRKALDLGLRPSDVIHEPIGSLAHLVSEASAGAGMAPGNGEGLVSAGLGEECGALSVWLDAVERLDRVALQRELRLTWSSVGASRFVLDYAVPFMRLVGERWSNRDLVVMHEHFASELLRDFLTMQTHSLGEFARGTRVICATLPGELHSLGIHMASVLLAIAGLEVVFLGANTPVEQIVLAAKQPDVQIVVLGSSCTADTNHVVAQVSDLRAQLPDAVRVVVGGTAQTLLVAGIDWMADFPSFARWLSDVAPRLGLDVMAPPARSMRRDTVG